MDNLNNDGFINLKNIEVEEESEEIILLKKQIDEMREWHCDNLANLLCDELKELRERK